MGGSVRHTSAFGYRNLTTVMQCNGVEDTTGKSGQVLQGGLERMKAAMGMARRRADSGANRFRAFQTLGCVAAAETRDRMIS